MIILLLMFSCSCLLVKTGYSAEPRVRFVLRGITYLNNSVIAINNIGEGANALRCETDNTDCCARPNGISDQGEFYFPNQSLVEIDISGSLLYRYRGPQVVRLNRRNNALSPTGVYRCKISDSNGMNQSIYIEIIEPRVRFMLRGLTYLNNSAVAINDIGEGDNALLCLTDNPDCCNIRENDNHYPNGGLVRNPASGDDLYRNRGSQVVRLNRRNNPFSPTGIYRCDIPDFSGMDQSIYIDVKVVFIQLLLSGINDCPAYRQDNANGIIQDVTNGLVEAIQELCECNVTSNNILRSLLECFTETTGHIAFRAELKQTSQATTLELVSYIDRWIRNRGHLIVQGSLLQVNTTCPLVITDLLGNSTECLPPLPGNPLITGATGATTTIQPSDQSFPQSDTPIAIVGGVVAILGLALILLAVIITYLLLKLRRMRGVNLKKDTSDIPPICDEGQSSPDEVQSSPVEMLATDNITYEDIDQFRSFDYNTCQAYLTTDSMREGVVKIEGSDTPTEDVEATSDTIYDN